VTPACIRTAWRQQLDNPAMPIVIYLGVVGWLAVASGGVAPDVVEHTVPAWLAYAWSGSLAAGGTLATVAGMTGRTRGESAGLALLLFGLGLYGWSAALERWPVGLGTVSALLALMACCYLRMRVLRLARRAVRVARREVRRWTS